MTWNGRVPAFRAAANPRETAAWEPAETLDQGEQGADEEKAEQHVEQQLLVRPLRAVGRGAELGAVRGVEQVTEVCRDPLQVGIDVSCVHRSPIECGALCGSHSVDRTTLLS